MTKMQIIMWGIGSAIVAVFASSGLAAADGYDPYLMENAAVICKVADGVDRDAGPMIPLFNRYGAQYTADTVNAVCPRNNMKVLAAIMGAHQLGIDIRR